METISIMAWKQSKPIAANQCVNNIPTFTATLLLRSCCLVNYREGKEGMFSKGLVGWCCQQENTDISSTIKISKQILCCLADSQMNLADSSTNKDSTYFTYTVSNGCIL